MRQLLDPSSFSERAFADRENASVFGSSWQFVAVDAELSNSGDYRTVNSGGRQWILRRGRDGVVRAFANVCLHRGARICTGAGSGPMRCRYHGWTYDDEGQLVGLPFRNNFEEAQDLLSLRLPQARIQAWGPALFLNPDPASTSLEDELGTLHGQLDPLYRAMGALRDYAFIDVAANWKIVMENALEGYHVSFVHGGTIQPIGFEVVRTAFHGPHSFSDHSAPPSPRKMRAIAFAFPDRPYPLDGYQHAFVFPNSTVATAYGNFFVLTRTEPLDAERTRLHWYMFATRCAEQSEAARDAAQLIDESNRQFLRTTFEEDGATCALTHDGCREATSHGYLGAQEDRVLAFERAVCARVSEYREPPHSSRSKM